MRTPLFIYIGLYLTAFIGGCTTNAEEFLYPVAVKEGDRQQVYVVYQKSLHHVELWLWDPISKIANKALLSSFTPAGLQILPDKRGFSFIDNGRIKIKHDAKRSPRALDIYEPVYDIGMLAWVDDYYGYFQAKQREHYGIFQVSMDGAIAPLALHAPELTTFAIDCMYPQKIDSTLFYIERHATRPNAQYTIACKEYVAPIADSEIDDESATIAIEYKSHAQNSILNQKSTPCLSATTVFDFGSTPIAFLHMASDHEGFVIEHPDSIDKHDATMAFVCYHLYKKQSQWQCEPLFSFTIPLDFLLPDRSARLYESMLPLLPRYHGDTIIFADASRNTQGLLDLFCYQQSSATITDYALCKKTEQAFFAPLFIDEQTYVCGGNLQDAHDPCCMWIDKADNLCFDLPIISKVMSKTRRFSCE